MPVVIRKEDQRDGGGGYAPPSPILVKVCLIGEDNRYVVYKMTSPIYTRVAMDSGTSAVKYRADCGDYRIKIKMISLMIDEYSKNKKLGNIKYIEIRDGMADGNMLLREYEVLNMSPLKYKRRYRYGKMTGAPPLLLDRHYFIIEHSIHKIFHLTQNYLI